MINEIKPKRKFENIVQCPFNKEQKQQPKNSYLNALEPCTLLKTWEGDTDQDN